jgi:hypothetical protein
MTALKHLQSGCLGCPAHLWNDIHGYHVCADDGLGEGRVKKIRANTLRSCMPPFWCPRRRDNRRKQRDLAGRGVAGQDMARRGKVRHGKVNFRQEEK